MSLNSLVRDALPPLMYKVSGGKAPTGLMCGGFLSTMESTKAQFFEQLFVEKGYCFRRFDYTGKGKSAAVLGAPVEVNLVQWKEDVLAMIDDIKGPVVLIGSSMGGHLAVHAAMERPSAVRGLLLIAPAIDFISRHATKLLSASNNLNKYGEGEAVTVDDLLGTVILRKQLIDAASSCLDLFPLPGNLAVRCPVRIVHGMRDALVPFEGSLRLCEKLESENVDLIFRKSGEHWMSTPEDLKLLSETLMSLYERINESTENN